MTDVFIPAEIINLKRNGRKLSPAQIQEMVTRYYLGGDVLPQQMAAFAMAICLNRMDSEETTALTHAMWTSGQILAWPPGRPKVDKHSSGGIGDKISIPLAPILACLGLDVPMISGRGLDFTGGTLDKLESISGYKTDLSLEDFQKVTTHVGCSINGATKELAPADQQLYALRNETGTVESTALITASILSKKLAAGLDALILDVKVGSGAFMENIEQALELARSLVDVGNRLGMKTRALITDMNQPLGQMVGNTLEVDESIDVLRGTGPTAVLDLTVRLAEELLELSNIESDRQQARRKIMEVISSGRGLEKLSEMVAAHGGDLDAPRPRHPAFDFVADRDGFIQHIHGRELGYAVIAMGGGRKKSVEPIDHGVGFQILVRLGDRVHRGDCLAKVYFRGDRTLVQERLCRAFTIGDERLTPPPLVLRAIDFDRHSQTLQETEEFDHVH